MSDSQNKNPFSDPNYGSDLTPSGEVSNPFSDPSYGKGKSKGIKGHLQDTATSLMSGAASLPDIAIGIGDIYTEGRVGKAIDDSGIYKTGEGQKYWSDKKTDIAKEQDKTRQSIGNRQINDDDSVLDKTGKILSNIKDKGEYVLSNPSQITNAIGESIAPMVAGGVVGRLSKIANPVVAGAVGEGTVMAGSQAEQIRQQSHDGLLNNGQEAVATATGVLGGLFGFAGGRLAQKMGIADVDTMLVTGRAGPADIANEIASMPAQSLPRRVIEGAISEGLLEELPQSISEQVLQNLALDKPWHDGIEDAIVMGTLSGMAMGGGANILSGRTNNAPSEISDAGSSIPPMPNDGNGGNEIGTSQSNTLIGQENTAELFSNHISPDIQQFDEATPTETNETPAYREQPTPSQQMGIDPEAGPMSAAAAVSVDSGVSDSLTAVTDQVHQQQLNPDGLNDFDYQPVVNDEQVAVGGQPQNPSGFQSVEGIGAEFGEIDHPLADWVKSDTQQRLQWAKDAGLNPIQQRHVVNTKWPKISEQLREQITAVMPSSVRTEETQKQSVERSHTLSEAPVEQASFKKRIQDAHLNNPSLKMELIQNEVALGRPRAEVLAEVGKAVKEISDFQSAISNIEAKEPLPGATLINEGTSQTTDNEIQTIESQLASTKSVPQKLSLQKKLNTLKNTRAANEAATSPQNDLPEPTQAQIEAGNYKKGHIKVHGLDIAVENPKGSERRGTDPDGKAWPLTMSDHYGYIKKTTGADNENIDTYVGKNPESDQVYIVDQLNQETGGFDEHKVMLGFNSQEEAVKAYQANFDKGWKVGPIQAMDKDQFKTWLKDGDTTKPATPKNLKEGLENIRAEKIRKKTVDDLHRLFASAPDLDIEKAIDRLDKAIQKNHEKSIGEMDGGKRSTRKAVASGAVDTFRKQKMDLEVYLKARKAGEVAQREKLPEKTTGEFTQIQTEIGLTHHVPSNLFDKSHKLGDVVNDLASMKTEGVKTNVLYGKQLLAKIAKLNPGVQMHIVSDLNSIKDNTIRAGLVDGGYYVPAQNTSYIYPKSDAWESSVLELVNHELVHTVTEYSLSHGVVSDQLLNDLQLIRDQIDAYRWENPEGLSENVKNRFAYLIGTNPDHETLAVGIAESEVRQALKVIISESGLSQLDTIYNEIFSNQVEQNEQRKQSKNSGNGKISSDGGIQTAHTPTTERVQKLSETDRANQRLERSSRTDQADLFVGKKQQGLINNDNGQIKQRSSGRADQKGTSEGIPRNASGVPTTVSAVRASTGSSKNIKRSAGDQQTSVPSTEENKTAVETQDKSNDKKRFSRAQNSTATSTVAQAREALVSRFGKKTIADLEAQGILNIVDQPQAGMDSNVEGWYENGKVTLVASRLDADSAVATFLHELGGHGGFQNLMNKDAYADLMRQFERMVEQGNPVAIEAKRLAERELKREAQLDEYLPYLVTLSSQMQVKSIAHKATLKRFMDRILSAVKAWLYDKGIKLNLNENDVLALAERMVEKQTGISASDRIKSQFAKTQAWMKAPNGSPTNLTEQQWLQVRTPAFKRWFGDWEKSAQSASKAVDENGEPKIYYHGTAAEFNEFKQGGGLLGRGVYVTDDIETAKMYAAVKVTNKASSKVLPLFVNTKQTMQSNNNTSREQIEMASTSGRFDGIRHSFKDMDFLVAFNPSQVKHAFNNEGSFDGGNADIRFSRQINSDQVLNKLSDAIKSMSVKSVKDQAGFKVTDLLGIGLSFLGRRQLTEIYGKLLPQLNKYNDIAAQMDADKSEAGAKADTIAREWSKLKDEDALATLMHEATLAQIDPSKPFQTGDSVTKYKRLRAQYNSLSPDAQKIYADARDAYKDQLMNVKQAIQDRIVRASMSNEKKAELMQQMDDQFFKALKGVYFPLARFGKYVVIVRDKKGVVESVNRSETMAEAQKNRVELQKLFPDSAIDRVILDKDFNASRDGVGRGFMTNLFNELGSMGLDTTRQAELEDVLGQLYLNSMPDLSWAKHGIHRKGTAGFSQDARRAFAQNMFHGASYLAKLKYSDLLAEQLDKMQKHATDESKKDTAYDQPKAQRVINEMNLRHENLMNPKSHPLSSTLTSVGFIYYLGLSPAAAMVNLSQTALVAYPIMGAKWGFDKASKELLKASNDFRKGVDFHKPEWNGLKTDWYKTVSADISKFLSKDELQAYKDAVDRGVIDVTQAHDLAGIAQGEDSGVMWKMRPIMRAASTMFHSAERFNREVTFIASYRLARGAGVNHETAFDQAVDATYKGHFDYSSGNRPRVMQGNVAKVLLLFKQFSQNMVYTLARQTYQSFKAETQAEKIEAGKALGAVLGMHAIFAGVLGLPVVWILFAVASWWEGDDDDPWDAEIALRNYLAEAFNPTISNLIMKGAPRALTPIDMSGRVGINNMLMPDVQEGLEGKRWAESAMSAALGPIAGIGTNIVKGAQEISEGHNLRGIETMLPVFLKNFAKTYRYGDEGVQDKTGISVMDEVSAMNLLVQGMGFSPSVVRTANEGKSAIFQMNRKLNERRSSLMTLWSRAKMMDDQDEMDSIWQEIQGFNEKNPSRRITRINLNQSYRNRQRRIDRAEDGIYLSKNRQDARDAGRFAFGE